MASSIEFKSRRVDQKNAVSKVPKLKNMGGEYVLH